MKFFIKVFTYSVILTLNLDKDKYLNYGTSTIDNTTRNTCVHCHDSERFNFFGVTIKTKYYDGGYKKDLQR